MIFVMSPLLCQCKPYSSYRTVVLKSTPVVVRMHKYCIYVLRARLRARPQELATD